MELKDNIKTFINKSYSSTSDLFSKIAEEETIRYHIHNNFVAEINKREESFPTGINGPIINFAIPHTDPENIKEPFIAVIKPTEPVKFRSMGIDDSDVFAEIIVLLGVVNNGDQIEMLQRLMELFMDENKVASLMVTKDENELRNNFREYVFG